MNLTDSSVGVAVSVITGYGAGYATGMTAAQPVPASTAGAVAPGGYPDYNRMQVTQAGQPGAAAGAPADSTGAPDYSAYG